VHGCNTHTHTKSQALLDTHTNCLNAWKHNTLRTGSRFTLAYSSSSN